MAEDSELWDIICDGPHVPMKKLVETGQIVPKDRKEYSDIDIKVVEKNYCAKKILMKRKKDIGRREPKKEKNLVLKDENIDSSEEDSDMAYLTKRFQKMVQRNGGIPKRGSSTNPVNNDLCHRYGKPGHFIKDCPLLKQEQYKQSPDKVAKRNTIPDKPFSRKSAADNIVKQALATWGNFSSESEGEPDAENNSMMAVETEETKYDSFFTLMA
uniref:Uncharacterized protein LOC104226242 n=1 Tax=Nicotiana sylvestris TaxID=4096 RepID=A0A1U7WGV9_NICSY|nr:PREDICTED: uncharacterized protein LOC104226242 [Nicotiana sylvestris]